MINKEAFIKLIGEDAVKIYEKLILAEKTGADFFTNEFYPPIIWEKLLKLKLNVTIAADGLFGESQRRMIGFTSDNADNIQFPYCVFKVENRSKFNKLTHSDYLGALMSLGFVREKIGDLLVEDQCCFFPASQDIADYIKDSLHQIGKSPCKVSIITDLDNVPDFKYETLDVISTSERLDSIVSALTGLSRSKALAMITSGKIMVNYVEIREKSYNVGVHSLITIRGYGKFRFSHQSGTTGSGRMRLKVKKFV